ncbi:MAG: hypothetical protein JWM80_6366 [Cyanobacteria bacterium RYN_339]|nr:hypothetical protein [Cyanobacteria bacterium RYN_339]
MRALRPGAGEAVGFPFFWRPDSQAVRLLTVGSDTLVVFDLPVSGEASLRSEFPVADDNPEGDRGHGPWQATPDGRWLVAKRQRDIHTPTALVALDVATHKIHRLGPPADETILAAASTTFLARSGAYPHFGYYWMKLPASAQAASP